MNTSANGDESIKWGGVNLDLYRFYSHFVGDDPNIIADDVFHIVVEPCLNNQESIAIYADKNMFERLLPKTFFPTCVLRNMDGDYMDGDYSIIQMDNAEYAQRVLNNEMLQKKGRLIVKPTKNTNGGSGVRLFTFNGTKWQSYEGEELSLSFLEKKYKRDFIIQQTIEPCEFVRQFNPTSYSTFRIFIYRSVKDDHLHYIGGHMRIGGKNSFKDNVHSGGFAVDISPFGKLATVAIDQNRKQYDIVNGISLKGKNLCIPHWDDVLLLCYDIAEKVTPCRLLSFDIMLDEEERPHAIEFNIKDQTVTTVQTTSKPFFGEYTDEVIAYCASHLHKKTYPLVIRKRQ